MVSKTPLATALLSLCLAASISTPAVAAYDSDELTCRKVTSKSWSKAIKIGQKVIGKCHKLRNLGKISDLVDCNTLDMANADDKGKFAKLKGKLEATVDKHCRDSGIDGDVLSQYISCPEPCSTDLGLNNPLADYDDLSACMGCVAQEIAQDFGVATQGSPAAPLASKDDQKCHQLLGKGYGKYLFTLLKERSGCQNDAENAGGVETLGESGCLSYDGKTKIDGARVKAEGLLDKACPAATLANVDSCTATSLGDLKTCLDAITMADGNDAVSDAYELEATVCPTSFTARTVAGTPVSGGPSGPTNLEAGWNGLGHGQDIIHDFATSIGVNCAASSTPCGSCPLTGIVDAGEQYQSFTRCKEDTSIECDTPFSTDPDCPGLQECEYFFGPPLPLSASNTPICAFLRVGTDVTGNVNIETGDIDENVDVRAVLYNGLSLSKPCPICVGDTTPKDGVKDGTCEGGFSDGQACDVQGFSATFANGEGTSLDCRLNSLPISGGDGLALELDLTTASASLPFNLACDFPNQLENCACAVCSGDNTLACNSDAECMTAGAGTCTAIGGSGASREPNSCADGICTDQGGGNGLCLAGPSVKACDGITRANGEGFILCNVDSECETGTIGIEAGACTLTQSRNCFLDPIEATGTPDPDNPVVVSTYCVPPTTSGAANAATGLPGPSRAKIELQIQRNY
jgi:hypothetical protein